MRGTILIAALILVFSSSAFLTDEPSKIIAWPEKIFQIRQVQFPDYRELGRKLFYEPALSADGSISCASCHSPFHSFAHADHRLSHGIGDSIGTRNAPALLNLAWQRSFMWDGAIHHLKAVPLAPLHHSGEMASSMQFALHTINQSSVYSAWLKARNLYPIDTEIFTDAMASFLSSLVSENSRYDRMNRGEIVFTTQEKRGYEIFQMHCNRCHSEPLFTNGTMERNGLPEDSIIHDLGLEKITGNTNDRLKFKIPTLRNWLYSSPYMHDGRFARINDVLRYYTTEAASPLGVRLDAEQRTDLAVFLKTLNDSSFVFNPENQYSN
jgi:cytochrome c peroxidase